MTQGEPAVRAVKLPAGNTRADRRSSLHRRAMSLSSEASAAAVGGHLLKQVDVSDFFNQEDHPICIIDSEDPMNQSPGEMKIVFANDALRSQPGLLDNVCGVLTETSKALTILSSFADFKAWILDGNGNSVSLGSIRSVFDYAAYTWTCKTLGKQERLRIVSGSHHSTEWQREAHRLPDDLRSSRARSGEFYEVLNQESRTEIGSSGPVNLPRISKTLLGRDLSISPKRLGDDEETDKKLPLIELATGDPMLPPADSEQMEQGRARVSTNAEPCFFDWTRLPSSPRLPPHIRFVLSVDWASTSLGPIETWSWDLRSMCNLIMSSPFAAAFYWGDDLVAIYNEAYIPLAGKKHPALMGMRYRDAWKEIWTDIEPVFIAAKTTATATSKEDDKLFVWRHDYLEETYYSWSVIPIIGSDGAVQGAYNPAFEKTRRQLAERRMLTLREIGECTAAAREVKGFWSQVLRGLESNPFDASFVMLYSVSDDPESDASSMHSGSMFSSRQCVLEGTLGVPSDHQAAPSQIDLKNGMEGFGPVFREAMRIAKPVAVSVDDGTLSEAVMTGIGRGYPEPCRTAVVCPIHPTTGESVLGFLVIGVNQRKRYDDEYSLFISLLSRQLATAVASVVLFEEEIRRSRRAAKLAAEDRIALSNQLAIRTQEAAESENRFTKIWENAPVGMFIGDSSGRMTHCNDMWFDISRHPRNAMGADAWIESVKDEDKALVRRLFADLVDKKIPSSAAFRFKTPWLDKKGRSSDTWVLFSAYPETDQSGGLKSVFGCLTNISDQKRAEDFQRQRMEEAVELKRQQENFIDITSHEMRNPLSAMLQCADEISTSLTEYKNGRGYNGQDQAALDSCVEAAETIYVCAQHQKRIINDILNLSKLDSAMLLVTPVDSQPKNVVQKAMKMFDNEAQKAGVNIEFRVEDSITAFKIDWVRLDPSRLLQVLINLITNAIKFTSAEAYDRRVIISMGVSSRRPSTSEGHHVSYFPSAQKDVDFISDEEWGKGQILYFSFSVRDTGKGLTESEKTLLFRRFSQASPRTHVTYGGSGLGLYISKRLVELQGGEIGVSSTSGEGSTFAFWIQCRRSSAPKAGDQIKSPTTSKPVGAKGSPVIHIPKSFEAPKPMLASTVSTQTWMNIMVVEDNVVNSRVLTKQLQKHGFAVTVANHGGEALGVLRGSRHWRGNAADAAEINLILMDLEMPVMDGLTCTRTIREMEQDGRLLKKFPIIAVSANAREEQVAHALEAGVDDVVSKPFRVATELLPKVHDLIEKKQ